MSVYFFRSFKGGGGTRSQEHKLTKANKAKHMLPGNYVRHNKTVLTLITKNYHIKGRREGVDMRYYTPIVRGTLWGRGRRL